MALVKTRTPAPRMSKTDVLAWVARVRHQNIAKREDRCMMCTQTPKLMRTVIPAPETQGRGKPAEPEVVAIYWCLTCQRGAFGSASYCRDRKLDFSQLEEVDVPKVQQELF